MTLVCVALLAISVTQKDWVGELFGSPVWGVPVNENTYVTLQLNWANSILALLSLGLANLWFSTEKSS